MKTKNAALYRSIGAAACAGTALLLASSVSAQNLFVSNFQHSEIDEINSSGVITPFATGMDYPYGLVFNSAGDLFVANTALDAGNSGYITEITPGGTQSTFASGLDPKAMAFNGTGNLFVGDYHGGEIYEFAPNGTRTTFSTGFSTPMAMTFNSLGDLFVAGGYGNGNGYIDEITPGGTTTTFASGLSFPNQLAFNAAGELFEVDAGSSTIYEFTPGGAQSTFASVTNVNGIAFDSAGDLFAVSSDGPIYKFAVGGGESTFTTEAAGAANLAFQPVPEPTTLGLIGAGGFIFAVRRRTQKS